jgi:hypothetical protein
MSFRHLGILLLQKNFPFFAVSDPFIIISTAGNDITDYVVLQAFWLDSPKVTRMTWPG